MLVPLGQNELLCSLFPKCSYLPVLQHCLLSPNTICVMSSHIPQLVWGLQSKHTSSLTHNPVRTATTSSRHHLAQTLLTCSVDIKSTCRFIRPPHVYWRLLISEQACLGHLLMSTALFLAIHCPICWLFQEMGTPWLLHGHILTGKSLYQELFPDTQARFFSFSLNYHLCVAILMLSLNKISP